MIETFPLIRPFLPALLRWRLVDATVEGPAGFGLPADSGSTDGGGWWVAEFGDMQAGTPAMHRALRAMAGRLRGGRRVDVTFMEKAPTGGVHGSVPFSDGTLFSDGTGFTGGLMEATFEDALSLRADEALIRITTGHALIAGEMFSVLRSPDLGSELHCTSAVEQVEEDLWSVELFPPMRQDHEAGVPVNFNNPACAMRLQDPEGNMWPSVDRNWRPKASARFVEALR